MNTCVVDECGRSTRYKLYCDMHQQRMSRHGTTDAPAKRTRSHCKVEGCPSLAVAHCYCNKHLKRWRSYGDPLVRYQGGTVARPVSERFFDHFTPAADGCWEWQSTISVYGYGVISDKVGTRWVQHKAHRLSYEIHKGPIPEGLQICHTCDNRKCVNPDHLYAGTVQDNGRDKRVRNRIKGHRHPQAKLNPEQVVRILALYAEGGRTQAQIGQMFGVGQSQVSKIIRGDSGHSVLLAAN